MENKLHYSVTAHTLGCKVNQCDTEAVLKLLKDNGCVISTDTADVYVINTCTVTHTSDKKSRQIIRRAKRNNPDAIITVCGCMAKSDPDAVKNLAVDFVFDARTPQLLLDFLLTHECNHNKNIKEPCTNVQEHSSRTRTFIKIQDGCDRFCAYCIIPYVRGTPTSRPLQHILDEIGLVISNGTREVVLTGIQVASYGEDTVNTSLANLIDQICKTFGNGQISDMRLRLSSLEQCAISDEFISTITSSSMVCDHFHLSLQSGCDITLKRMNRRYTTAEYELKVNALRTAYPNCAITTDIIVGFPGETDEEFDESLNFAKKIGFANIHVFEYSKREGTPAATFDAQVSDISKTARSKQMRELAAQLSHAFNTSQIGKTLPVLFEKNNIGHTTNYCQVMVNHAYDLSNKVYQVKITSYTESHLEGEVIIP